MQRSALVTRLARHVLDLGHVRHVANAQPAIVEEGDHPVDLHLRQVADGSTRGEFSRQVDSALAHVGERPLPASFREAEGPIVAQLVDGDLPDLGAADEMSTLFRPSPGACDDHSGGAEIEVDSFDPGRMVDVVDDELRRHGMDLVGRRQDTRQRHAAVVATDVDGNVPDLPIAAPVDLEAPRQGDVDPAQDRQIRRKIREDPRLEAADPGLERDATAIPRVGAGERQVDRVAVPFEARIGRDEDACGVATELSAGAGRRPGEPGLQIAQDDVRSFDQHRVELADQGFVVRLGQQLVDEDRHRCPLRPAFLRGEDALEHAALARDVRLDLRARDDD